MEASQSLQQRSRFFYLVPQKSPSKPEGVNFGDINFPLVGQLEFEQHLQELVITNLRKFQAGRKVQTKGLKSK